MKTIFFGGKILTMNNQSPVAHALVIENNKILALGPYDDLMKTIVLIGLWIYKARPCFLVLTIPTCIFLDLGSLFNFAD